MRLWMRGESPFTQAISEDQWCGCLEKKLHLGGGRSTIRVQDSASISSKELLPLEEEHETLSCPKQITDAYLSMQRKPHSHWWRPQGLPKVEADQGNRQPKVAPQQS